MPSYLGAVNGQATAGAIGAASGELFAELLVKQFYGGDKSKLTQQQKLQIANLSAMLAGALAGTASDSTQGAVAGAQTGKNATENNYLSDAQEREKQQQLSGCPNTLCEIKTEAQGY